MDDWMGGLRLRYSLRDEPAVRGVTVFFDTFDGRLFDRGLVCAKTGSLVRLYSFERPEAEVRAAVEPFPRFAAGLPEGKLRDRLSSIAKDRALLEMLRLGIDRRSWRVLNRDQKTVAHVAWEDMKACDDAQSARLGAVLRLESVRGYEQVAEEIERRLKERGFREWAGVVYPQALEALDKNPKRFVKQARVYLEDSMPAADAVRAILKSLYEAVRINEPGVRADTDAEFLHDYRVAVRKARSLVGRMRGVFAHEPTAAFRKSLSWLGRSTNTLRDLDVYLLHRPRYEGWLGAPLDQAIEPLFVHLETLREGAFHQFVAVMDSADYAAVLQQWGTLVEEPAVLGAGRRGMQPIEKAARARLAKQCRQVLERGYEVTDATAPEALHALRIECKHLRYLIEFFPDLVPEAEHLVHRMKKLQDALGAIQDLTAQEERLRHYLEGPEIQSDGAGTAAAIETLIARVRAERETERGRVSKLFARFNRRLGASDPPYGILLPWLRA